MTQENKQLKAENKQLKAENKKLHEQKQAALGRLDKADACSADVTNMQRKVTEARDRQGKLTRENKQLKADNKKLTEGRHEELRSYIRRLQELGRHYDLS
jgi:cell division protein FtsB|tara:strand:- start:4213 stop:4512 length:300 start_codon:yes stop_codon:yes gene_type:complete